ncbi:MAG: transcriptional repressor LexA [Planctomycetota bacterium]
MARLTPKQKRVLDEIRAHVKETGFSPTYEELANRCGVSKSTVRQYLRALKEKGAIRRQHYGHRSIEVIGDDDKRKLPVVGRVAAGAPLLAVENIDDRVDVGELFTKRGPKRADFLLRVKGDSMTGAGILDGDLVAVRQQPEVAQGEIGVVVVNDEATVKRAYVRGRKVRLVSENPAFKPMEFDAKKDEVRVVGKVVGVLRGA